MWLLLVAAAAVKCPRIPVWLAAAAARVAIWLEPQRFLLPIHMLSQ
jgi:hypothetical protein